MGYIYLVTNNINQKKYVGQSICKDINLRWNQHKRKDSKTLGKHLLNAYNKYGIENFSYSIICICFDEDCNKYEKEYIKKYNTLAPNGYNLTSGGKNSKPHYLTLERRAIKMKGKKFRKRTVEEKQYLSDIKKGSKNPNFGKKMTEEQKNKISETMKNKLYIHSEKAINALLENTKLTRKKVGKYDLEGKFIEKYTSLTEAANKNNIGYQHISKVCNGNRGYKTAGGFIWKFLSDDIITS